MTVRPLFYLLAFCSTLFACSDQQTLPENAIEHSVQGSFDAQLSADGSLALISSVQHGVALWDLKANTLKYNWRHQEHSDNLVLATAISFNNQFAVTAEKTAFAVWSIETGENIGFWKIKDSAIRDIAISNSGRYILYGKSNGVVIFLDRISGRRLEFIGHQEKINSIALSPNGKFALTGSNDYVAYFWNTETGQVIHRFDHPSRVTQVALDNQGRFAFTADSQKQAQIWQLTNGKKVSRLEFASRQLIFSAAKFNESGTLLATGSPNRTLILWDVKSGQRLKDWKVAPRKNSRPKSAVVYDVVFTNNDSTLLTESSSGYLESWKIEL